MIRNENHAEIFKALLQKNESRRSRQISRHTVRGDAADDIKPAFSKVRGIVVFGFIYRFGPVAFTPVANKLSAMFFPCYGREG